MGKPAALLAARITAIVWIAACAVQFIVWAMIMVISADLVAPWWIWTVLTGAPVVLAVWWVTGALHAARRALARESGWTP
jgi:hypothetical protein